MPFNFTPSKNIEVPEIQYEKNLVFPARKTALIVVDMQNDFLNPEGNLYVPAARDSVPNIQKLLGQAREMGVRVAFTQDTHFQNDPEWAIWPKHCEKDTWGWRIIEELKPERSDLICEKNRYDGFYGSWLDHFLRNNWQVENLVIVGTMANICVAHTAASAGLRWYEIAIPANGISAQNEFDQAMALRQASTLYNGSVVETTEQIQFVLEKEVLNQNKL